MSRSVTLGVSVVSYLLSTKWCACGAHAPTALPFLFKSLCELIRFAKKLNQWFHFCDFCTYCMVLEIIAMFFDEPFCITALTYSKSSEDFCILLLEGQLYLIFQNFQVFRVFSEVSSSCRPVIRRTDSWRLFFINFLYFVFLWTWRLLGGSIVEVIFQKFSVFRVFWTWRTLVNRR